MAKAKKPKRASASTSRDGGRRRRIVKTPARRTAVPGGAPVTPAAADADGRMTAPPSGVKVRMYRQGHGDCFLLAFRKQDGSPFYMLIDFGMKKGSAVNDNVTTASVANNIAAATGGHLDLVVITHEHEDHVSGFLSAQDVFKQMTIDELWLAWTEDPEHDLANQLRERYHDTLLGLVAASDRLHGATGRADIRVRGIVDTLLGFELDDLPAARANPQKIGGITLKRAMQVVKDRAATRRGVKYLRPHDRLPALADVPGVRVFVLGPPEDEGLLKDPNPREDEEFHLAAAAASAGERAFVAAVAGSPGEQELHQPFDARHRIPDADAAGYGEHGKFFEDYYGFGNTYPPHDDRSWRRIDGDWLRASEQMALRMSTHINNTSVVLAFELPQTRRVLLFVGDAQRGNWVSWGNGDWDASKGLQPGEKITCKDLLSRTVFYKVGHHGSHNATLNKNGLADMAQGEFSDHFVAMIPAHEKWAIENNTPPWYHPLEAIYKALLKKARGRVLVLDRDPKQPAPQLLSPPEWDDFIGKCRFDEKFFEYTVKDA